MAIYSNVHKLGEGENSQIINWGWHMTMSTTMFDELYCKMCGAPLSQEEMADNEGKNEICDACRDDSEG